MLKKRITIVFLAVLLCLAAPAAVLAATPDKGAGSETIIGDQRTIDSKTPQAINTASPAFTDLTTAVTAPTATSTSPGITMINTKEDLIHFAQDVAADTSYYKGKTVTLANDITLTGEWTPIAVFAGTFDGGGHSISGLSVTQGSDKLGLFSILAQGSAVKNLTVSGSIMTTTDPAGSAGGIAAVNAGTITGCVFDGTVNVPDNQSNITLTGLGGIAGLNLGTVSGCSTTAATTLTRKSTFAGGIVGMDLGIITQNFTLPGLIKNCTNNAAVVIINDSTETRTQVGGAGGIAGTVQMVGQAISDYAGNPRITGCTNNGTITGACSLIGGIAGGSIEASIANCTNTGAINQTKGLWAGGIVGSANHYQNTAFSITGCTNTGDVTGDTRIAGIVGGDEGVLSENRTLSGCINTGTISGEGYVAGINGYSRDVISTCYNTGDLINTLVGDDEKYDGWNAMGGIASRTAANISDCFNIGDLTTKVPDPLHFDAVSGGILGINDNPKAVIARCYNSGHVDGNHVNSLDQTAKTVYYGGILGQAFNNTLTVLENSTFNNTVAGKAQRAVASFIGEGSDFGLTAEAMTGTRAQANMAGLFAGGAYEAPADITGTTSIISFTPILKDLPDPRTMDYDKVMANAIYESPLPAPAPTADRDSSAVNQAAPYTGIADDGGAVAGAALLLIAAGALAAIAGFKRTR